MNPSELRPEPRQRQYRFNDFLLDVDSGFLRQGGQEIPLQPKAFEVLSYLVERHGRLVGKGELLDAVWRDTSITENSLSQCIVQIRRALSDDSHQMIRTVARRGYVFAGRLTTSAIEFPLRSDRASTEARPLVPEPVRLPERSAPQQWSRGWVPKLAILVVAVVAGLFLRLLPLRSRPEIRYTQITNFADSAAGPVLSADGRMVAFFRSASSFATPGPVYVKMLPNGDPVQITDDPRNKYGLAFSTDGSQLAYTVWEGGADSQWQTFAVPLPGDKPRLLFANAAGLTWLDQHRLLYSEIRTGLHMGIVTSGLNRADRREIYFPEHERRMAHYSYRSPDQKWLLVVEMEPGWLPCRIIPFDGSSAGRQVGPNGPCTAAGWSPDGKWMYFGAETGGEHHLWRQAFPGGKAEQITFGPTEEEGLAVAPDGRSLLTSVGVRQNAVWIHDAKGDRAISPEGYAAANYLVLTAPLFSYDGRQIYYLLRHESPASTNELWRTELDSDSSECVIRDFPIVEFDIAGDQGGGGEVVFSAQPAGQPSQLWLMKLDRSAPPRRIAAAGEASPRFGPDGTLWFRYSDGKANRVGLMNKDGSGRRQAAPFSISTVMNVAPDGRWLVAMAPAPGRAAIDTIAISADAGERRLICPGRCPVTWARDGKYVYLGVGPNATMAIPIKPGELPTRPAAGNRSAEKDFPGARVITGLEISPGPDPSTFAYVKAMTHRNLFRISLR